MPTTLEVPATETSLVKSVKSHRVELHLYLTLPGMIEEGRYDYVNTWLRSHLPKSPHFRNGGYAIAVTELFLLRFNPGTTIAQRVVEYEKRQLRPANFLELLAFGAEGWNGKDWIVAEGSAWRIQDDNPCVPVLYGHGSERRLGLYWDDFGWDGDGFLAARK